MMDAYRCQCGRVVEGKPYENRWGTSSCKLRFACLCGAVVYAYTGQQAAEEAAHDRGE